MITKCPKCGHNRHVKRTCATCHLFYVKGVFQ